MAPGSCSRQCCGPRAMRSTPSATGRCSRVRAPTDAPAETMDYGAVKLVHESAVAISAAGFFARGCGMLLGAGWVRRRAARTLPHVVDTVLLLSAIALAFMLRITPASAPWLGAKIVGTVFYVVLGVIAFRGRTRAVRIS